MRDLLAAALSLQRMCYELENGSRLIPLLVFTIVAHKHASAVNIQPAASEHLKCPRGHIGEPTDWMILWTI